jgi:hypothetical protein
LNVSVYFSLIFFKKKAASFSLDERDILFNNIQKMWINSVKRPEGDSDVLLQNFLLFISSPRSALRGHANNFCLLFIQLFFLFYNSQIFALTTEVLPPSIYSPAFRYGQINGLDERYSETGSLVRLTDYKSIEFDADTLAKFNTKANELIATLNKFGIYKAGDLFNLGTLEINTKPEIKYFAPVLAKGISETWTVGLGLPVLTYTNKISLSQKFSNIEYYNQFRGLSPELDQALDTDLALETQQALVNKGYKKLESQSQKFLGDIQLVSIKKIIQNINSSVLHLLTITLPTGPGYDADNLLALNTFHEFSFENKIAYVKKLFYFLELAPTISMKYTLPEKITARVPKNAGDVLPDQNSKDEITKTKGVTFETGLNMNVLASENLKLSGGFNIGQKLKDTFSGSSKGDTSVLADKTNSKWQKVNAEISYSTVQSYLKSQKFIPLILSLSVFDTIAGENIERQLGQELNMTLFF